MKIRAAGVRTGTELRRRLGNASDCPMAGHQIESGLSPAREPTHPLKLLRIAYGI